MKILQVSTLSFADPRYYRSNEFELCRSLAKLGHDVTVFCSDRHPKWQFPEERKAGRRAEFLEGFRVKRFPSGFELGIVPMMPTLPKELFHSECDIVHAHELLAPSSFYSAAFARFKKKPLVVTEHDYAFGNVHGARLFLHMAGDTTLGRCTMHTADVVIGLSSEACRFAQRLGAAPSKTVFIPSSVDTSEFNPDRKNLLAEKWSLRGKIILFVANLVRNKAPSVVLHAFRNASQTIPDAKLVILGKGPEEPRLRELQRELNLSNVFFIPRVPREQMPLIYPGGDMLVLPSVYEPFGNVVLEALASGLPVIGSKIGGMADVIRHGETGLHIKPGNEAQLSKYMQLLLANEALRKEMSISARRDAVERFDSMVVARQIEKIYQQHLGL